MAAPSFDSSQPTSTVQPTSAVHRGKSKASTLRIVLPLGLVAIAAGTAIWYALARPSETSLRLSGRIEGYETDIGAKTGGRVDTIAAREGDEVQAGQVLVRINDDEVQAQLRGSAAKVAAAQEQVRQAQAQIDVVESQIQEAQLTLQQSVGDASGRIQQAGSTVSAAKAQLAQAHAQEKQSAAEVRLAQVNRDRYAQLVAQGAINQQQFDQAQTILETAQATLLARQAAVNSAQEQLGAAQGGLAQVQTTGFNPGIRNAQLAALFKQRERAVAQLQAAQAEVKNAIAAQQQIQAQIGYLSLVSPIHGVVTARTVEPGAVVTNGKTVLTIVDLNSVYLRGFIPEGDLGKIRVGQTANVYLDSAPKQPLTAKVAAIDPQASFTPENIYFQKDRVKQVFGVKLTIDNPAGFAKPGMPADAEIVFK